MRVSMCAKGAVIGFFWRCNVCVHRSGGQCARGETHQDGTTRLFVLGRVGTAESGMFEGVSSLLAAGRYMVFIWWK